MLTARDKRFLGAVCAAILMVILIAGLWPFSFNPPNGVQWLSGRNGLTFTGSGIVYTHAPLTILGNDLLSTGLTMELWLRPDSDPARQPDSVGQDYILSLFNISGEREEFTLGQWKSWFIVRSYINDYEMYDTIGLDGALTAGAAPFITITSRAGETIIYIDGLPAKRYAGYTLIPREGVLTATVTLGNSAYGEHPWAGDLLALAMYAQPLTPDQVYNHYQQWMERGYPPYSEDERAVAIYPFDEGKGSIAHNRIDDEHHLTVSETFRAPQKKSLISPSRHFRLDRAQFKDIILNVAGFVPLGIFFAAYLLGAGYFSRRCSYTITIILGGAISLGIELLQIYMPTRYSSSKDLICNLLGTGIGVLLLHASIPSLRSWRQ